MSILNLFGKKKSPQELMAAGNYKAALKAVNEILKNKKKDPIMQLVRADIHMKMGNKSEARKGYIAVGEYYGDAGFFNKAVAVFKKALNITPNDKEILEKLAGYNNKVPKYILDSTFLKRASGAKDQKEAPASPEPVTEAVDEAVAAAAKEPETVTMEPPLTEELPEASFATTGEPAAAPPEEPETVDAPEPVATQSEPGSGAVAEFDTEDHEIEASPEFDTAEQEEPVVRASETAEDDVVDDGIDYDTLSDLSDALSAEFDKPFEPPVKASPVAEPEPAQEPAAAPQAQDTSPEGMPIGGGIVFSTRPTEVAKDDGDMGMDFSSLDDALDSLFASEASAPKEENSRHWALFRSMPEDAFLAFVVALEQRDYEPGNNIVEQGGVGDTMFLIADGEVDILIEKDGDVKKVASLGEGDFFGEASLLTGQPRNATVHATSPTSCLLLNKTQLDELTRSHPSIMESIETIYKARSRQNAGE